MNKDILFNIWKCECGTFSSNYLPDIVKHDVSCFELMAKRALEFAKKFKTMGEIKGALLAMKMYHRNMNGLYK